MIANLSSYIEFMAAVYVTMSIDNLILRRFWTRDYESMLGALFVKWRVPYISKSTPSENEDIEDLQKSEENLSRRRGLLMLTTCIFLLIFIGFEPVLDTSDLVDVAYTYFPLTITYCYVLLAFIFDHFFLSNKWSVLFSIIGIPLLFFSVDAIKRVLCFQAIPNGIISLLSPVEVYTVIVLIMPIIWQLTRNWLYSRKNMVRIQYLLKKELDCLNKARSYGKESNINEIAEWYRNDVVKKLGSYDTEDVVAGQMLETFNRRLREIIKSPRVRDLIPYIHRQPLAELEDSKISIYYSESVDVTFDALCREYMAMPNRPSLVNFAKSKKVNHREFKEYYDKWIIRNSKG